MTYESTLVRKIILLLAFCQLLILASTKNYKPAKTFLKNRAFQYSKNGIAPDVLNYDDYVTIQYDYNYDINRSDRWYKDEGQPRGLTIEIIGSEPNTIKHQCHIERNILSWDKFAWHEPIRRISYKTILFKLNVTGDYGLTGHEFILLNMDSCQLAYAYHKIIPMNHIIFINDDPNDERFSVMVYDEPRFCRGPNYCRLFFDPTFEWFKPYKFYYIPKGFASIGQTIGFVDKNHFILEKREIYQNKDKDYLLKYSTRLYDFSRNNYKYKQLYLGHPCSMAFDDSPCFNKISPLAYSFVISPLIYCWNTVNSNDDLNAVQCIAFNNNAENFLNTTIVYPDSIAPRQVQNITNGLAVISTPPYCEDNCSNIAHLALITRNFDDKNLVEIRYSKLQLKCDVSRVLNIPIRFNLHKDSVDIGYFCYDSTKDSVHKLRIALKSFKSMSVSYNTSMEFTLTY